SEELQDIAKAKLICAKCPVVAECLEGALERREPWGVWGGQLLLNGKVLQSKRRRGRPPKVPRPEDQLPEIPVPVHLRDRIVYKRARSSEPITPGAGPPPRAEDTVDAVVRGDGSPSRTAPRVRGERRPRLGLPDGPTADRTPPGRRSPAPPP